MGRAELNSLSMPIKMFIGRIVANNVDISYGSAILHP